MNNEKMKQLFLESGINKRWHFTKYGYYKLFRLERFLIAHLFQLCAFFALMFSMLTLFVSLYTEATGFQMRVLLGFAIASLTQAISELFVGEYIRSGKLLLGFLVFTYILIL